MDYLSPGIQIASIELYDSLEVFGKNRGEYRESKGNVITFGMNYTREEDGFSPDDKKGDVVVEKGSLDTSDNTLLHEIYVERDGAKVSRSVAEVIMLPDGSFLAQDLSKPFSQIEICFHKRISRAI